MKRLFTSKKVFFLGLVTAGWLYMARNARDLDDLVKGRGHHD